jgi:hypothetical protein
MPLPTTTIDLPRIKGIVLDIYPGHNPAMHFSVIPTEMGFISVKVLTKEGRTKLSLRDNRGRTDFDSITGGWWRTFDEAVTACRVSARKREKSAIVWLLTEPTTPDPT